jgi:hypothetical protein
MSSGMPMPEWASEAREQMFKEHAKIDYDNAGAKPRELEPLTTFTSHFAEYEVKGNDVLVHVFPRGGEEDRWYPEEYREGKYYPARREVKVEGVAFPEGAEAKAKAAVDKMWSGSVCIETVPELGAMVVQFQDAKTTAVISGLATFVDRFCESLDKELEG